MSPLYWVAFRVDDTKIKLPGTVNGTETELSHMAFFAKAVAWEGFSALNLNPHSKKLTSVSVGSRPLSYLFTSVCLKTSLCTAASGSTQANLKTSSRYTRGGTEPMRHVTLHSQLQKSRRNHRSYVWTKALFRMIFAADLSGRVWIQPKAQKDENLFRLVNFINCFVSLRYCICPSCSKGGWRYPLDRAIGFPNTYPLDM